MTGSVRARRPHSPPPPVYKEHNASQFVDADTKRALASKGYNPSAFNRTSSGKHSAPYPNAGKYYPPGGLSLTSGEIKVLIAITILACFIRLFRLSKPTSVVFDEVHFGKFAGKYIKTQYFVDVHPPLAKLLITLMGFIFGYDGHFDFKDIGKVYDAGVPYVAMRFLPAILGVCTVPLAYMTLRSLECRATTALLASFFIMFENGLATQSRHILLDSPLIFFTSLTTFLWVGFCNEDRHQPFTETWWGYLFLSGLSMGAALSVKWVGLFTVATVGVTVLYQLWLLLGDLRIPPRLFISHFLARALCLILVPILFYMGMFGIHFAILQSSGDGDGFMSSEFQHTLSGRHMADTYADVAMGSVVTIRHVNTQGGYLHSHPHVYPGGSKQQQITLYPHRDMNNQWQILNATHDLASDLDSSLEKPYLHEPLKYVSNGMRVKLLHTSTGKYLHSHDIRPPISDVEFQNEVSGYGMEGFGGDANDDWIVEIDKASTNSHRGGKYDKEATKRVRTLHTRIRFRHPLTGCYLFSHKVKLPDWGFEQQEVTCNKNAVRENSLWFVETNVNEILPKDATKINYTPPSFLSKFLELQSVMWTTNKGLTDRHTYDSRPESWIWLRRGINFWVKDHRHIYLIGNPFVWWLSSLSVFAYLAVTAIGILRAKRGYRDLDNTILSKSYTIHTFFFTAWFLHYFPFFLMARQLFLHHYFPALYFAIMLFSVMFDFLSGFVRVRGRVWLAFVLIVIAIMTFNNFSPLVYGSPWTKEKCRNAKWLKSWDFSCTEYLDDISAYDSYSYATIVAAPGNDAQATPQANANGKAEVVKNVPPPPPKGQHDDHDDDGDDDDHHEGDDSDDEDENVKAEVTSTIIKQAVEPGRDVFAEAPGAGGSSVVPKEIPVQPKQEEGKKEEDTKVISVVGAGAGAHAGIGAEKERVGTEGVNVPQQRKKVEEEQKKKLEEKKVEGPAPPPVAKEETTKEAVPAVPLGPPDEAALEAEKVAKELYGDTAGKRDEKKDEKKDEKNLDEMD